VQAFIHELTRFLPKVNRRLTLSFVEDGDDDEELKSGLLLPYREALEFELRLNDESDDERLRPSSARMSSRETLRCGCVYAGGLAVSRTSVNLEVILLGRIKDRALLKRWSGNDTDRRKISESISFQMYRLLWGMRCLFKFCFGNKSWGWRCRSYR